MSLKWTESQIASYLARFTFDRKHLVIVPRCSWPGSECDLLVVTPNLRVIDVEIKISRADLKADAKKDKWFHAWDYFKDGPYDWNSKEERRKPRQWPRNVWKHYYAMPRDIWTPQLSECLPSMASGVLLLYEHQATKSFHVHVERMAAPSRDAGRISAEDAVDVARLASLRMWDAFKERDAAVSALNEEREARAEVE